LRAREKEREKRREKERRERKKEERRERKKKRKKERKKRERFYSLVYPPSTIMRPAELSVNSLSRKADTGWPSVD